MTPAYRRRPGYRRVQGFKAQNKALVVVRQFPTVVTQFPEIDYGLHFGVTWSSVRCTSCGPFIQTTTKKKKSLLECEVCCVQLQSRAHICTVCLCLYIPGSCLCTSPQATGLWMDFAWSVLLLSSGLHMNLADFLIVYLLLIIKRKPCNFYVFFLLKKKNILC